MRWPRPRRGGVSQRAARPCAEPVAPAALPGAEERERGRRERERGQREARGRPEGGQSERERGQRESVYLVVIGRSILRGVDTVGCHPSNKRREARERPERAREGEASVLRAVGASLHCVPWVPVRFYRFSLDFT